MPDRQTFQMNLRRFPIAGAIANPDAPVPEQVAAWRVSFLNDVFFAKATKEMPITVVGRAVLEGEDSFFLGNLPSKELVASFVGSILLQGATWVVTVNEGYAYDAKRGVRGEVEKNQASKRECLVMAAYADGWSEFSVQPFTRTDGAMGLPMATDKLLVYKTSEGANFEGGMVPFSEPSIES